MSKKEKKEPRRYVDLKQGLAEVGVAGTLTPGPSPAKTDLDTLDDLMSTEGRTAEEISNQMDEKALEKAVEAERLMAERKARQAKILAEAEAEAQKISRIRNAIQKGVIADLQRDLKMFEELPEEKRQASAVQAEIDLLNQKINRCLNSDKLIVRGEAVIAYAKAAAEGNSGWDGVNFFLEDLEKKRELIIEITDQVERVGAQYAGRRFDVGEGDRKRVFALTDRVPKGQFGDTMVAVIVDSIGKALAISRDSHRKEAQALIGESTMPFRKCIAEGGEGDKTFLNVPNSEPMKGKDRDTGEEFTFTHPGGKLLLQITQRGVEPVRVVGGKGVTKFVNSLVENRAYLTLDQVRWLIEGVDKGFTPDYLSGGNYDPKVDGPKKSLHHMLVRGMKQLVELDQKHEAQRAEEAKRKAEWEAAKAKHKAEYEALKSEATLSDEDALLGSNNEEGTFVLFHPCWKARKKEMRGEKQVEVEVEYPDLSVLVEKALDKKSGTPLFRVARCYKRLLELFGDGCRKLVAEEKLEAPLSNLIRACRNHLAQKKWHENQRKGRESDADFTPVLAPPPSDPSPTPSEE